MRGIVNNLGFTLLWSVSWLVIWFAVIVIIGVCLLGGSAIALALWVQEEQFLVQTNVLLMFALCLTGLMGLLSGLALGTVQKSVLRIHTRDPWRGWIIASALGGMLGMVITVLLLGSQVTTALLLLTIPPPERLFWLALQLSVIPLGVIGITQAFVLGRFVRGAWTWILANITAGLVFFSLLAFSGSAWLASAVLAIPMVVLIASAPGIVTGFALVWLLALNKRDER